MTQSLSVEWLVSQLGPSAVYAAGALATFAATVLGWWLGRAQVRRAFREMRQEMAELRARLGEREREMATLRVKRETQLADLLEEVRLVDGERRVLAGQVSALKVERTQVETVLREERVATRHKLGLLGETSQKLEDAFKALAAEALQLDQQSQALDELIRPLQTSLEQYDRQLRTMERARAEAYDGLRVHVEAVAGSQERLRASTGSFVRALVYERLTGLGEQFEDLRRAL